MIMIALDGVFAEEQAGPPRVVQLPELASIDVAEACRGDMAALATVRSRVLRLLTRRGVVETTGDHLELASYDAADSDPVLAKLTTAAVSGLPPPCRRLGMPARSRVRGPRI